jgi:hypothetical protein
MRAFHGRLLATWAEAMQFSKITSRKLKQATNNADDGVGEAKTERMPPLLEVKASL